MSTCNSRLEGVLTRVEPTKEQAGQPAAVDDGIGGVVAPPGRIEIEDISGMNDQNFRNMIDQMMTDPEIRNMIHQMMTNPEILRQHLELYENNTQNLDGTPRMEMDSIGTPSPDLSTDIGAPLPEVKDEMEIPLVTSVSLVTHDQDNDINSDSVIHTESRDVLAKQVDDKDINCDTVLANARLVDEESFPLSKATRENNLVHNDYLKLMLVGDKFDCISALGRSLKKEHTQRNLDVDVHTWTPSNSDVNFRIWDFHSSRKKDEPGTQSLFFSDKSIYLLVYDLVASDSAHEIDSSGGCSYDEMRQEANQKSDISLEADIKDRVLSWIDCIVQRTTHSVILPIALFELTKMEPEEARRRCNIMHTLISDHTQKLSSEGNPPIIWFDQESVVSVSLDDNMGAWGLEQNILEVANLRDVFTHVGKPVPPGTIEIRNMCEQLRKGAFIVPVKHFTTELQQRPDISADVVEVLCFLDTIGDVLYFGSSHPIPTDYVFLPLDISLYDSIDDSIKRNFFVAPLSQEVTPRDIWTYKNTDASMATLCHSWLFRDGPPAGIMEHVTVDLLRDLYQSTCTNVETPKRRTNSGQIYVTAPIWSRYTEPIREVDAEPIREIDIDELNFWENGLVLKSRRTFRGEEKAITQSFEIFVAMTDQESPHGVASYDVQSNMQRLVVSVKGDDYYYGQKIWKAGYNMVLKSIKKSLKTSMANNATFERHAICPECLSAREACHSNSWTWDSVCAHPDCHIYCQAGHRVNKHLIHGKIPTTPWPKVSRETDNEKTRPLEDISPSIVIAGLWDGERIVSVGSGFIADKKLGLVVTASHTLFEMGKGNFGAKYKGLSGESVRVIIGVVPSGGENSADAVFRYFADIVDSDVRHMDACILQITHRFDNDVRDYWLAGNEKLKIFQQEPLSQLELATDYEIGQQVRLIGYNQGGEGRLEKWQVNTTMDYSIGFICRLFIKPMELFISPNIPEEKKLSPRKELVVNCFTIAGHSGGPCVRDDGKVIGILSRHDGTGQRCYLVPSSEINILLDRTRAAL